MVNNIEIYGIPKTSNENVYGIVKTIARILNCELSSDDIVYSSRKRSHHNNEGNIVVQFNSKTVKDLLINSVKSRYKLNNPLTAKDINPNFSNSKVYLNDQLTQYNKKLFWLAREVTKCYDYEYKWANLTGIFMAKQGQIFKISNLEELQKLDVEKKINALWE
ncbi:uncharacterized protein LOC112685029 [Sipha flava]|uniref:Uncharacterized protein LOC112685029 n=1 Tax=Sipha flava TaxID=143950 RepID=A0A8B8FQ10_9HEMI|nr:uncharacterized protein LOC112685029 [Sipha flava]